MLFTLGENVAYGALLPTLACVPSRGWGVDGAERRDGETKIRMFEKTLNSKIDP